MDSLRTSPNPETSGTPNQVIIDLSTIRHNLNEIRRLAGNARIMAVVKSDAYGHGMVQAAKTLEAAGADHLAVFETGEAIELRDAGCKLPILILMGMQPEATEYSGNKRELEQFEAVVAKKLTPVMYNQEMARRLSDYALSRGAMVPVHIKVDTGMTRLGIPWEQAPSIIKRLSLLKGICIEGMLSHFAVADIPEHPFASQQLERFCNVLQAARQSGLNPRFIHMANSGGILAGLGVNLGMVRPGILLYGSPPGPAWCPATTSFRPAMTFRSKIIQVQTVPKGTAVSYGCTYRTSNQAVIATIPAGYDNGYSRMLSNSGEVLIRGRRVPVIGRICMTLTMLDVTSLDNVSAGEEVILLGRQGEEYISAEEIASKANTINYEVYCKIGKSNPKVYVDMELADLSLS